MSTTTTIVPSGTVRRRFSNDDEDTLDELLSAICLTAQYEQFDPALVWTARRLVDNESGLDDTTRRRATLAVVALLIAIGEGSTRLPLEEPDYLGGVMERLIHRCTELSAEFTGPRAERLKQAASILSEDRKSDLRRLLNPETLPTLLAAYGGDEIAYRPLIRCDDKRALTSERLLRKEIAEASAFAKLITRRLEMPNPSDIQRAASELKSHPTRYRAGSNWHEQHLNHEQARALILAAVRPLSLITGGPGTGKTTIVVSVLRLLTRLGVAPEKIALAAPTGKAANRMKESIDTQLVSLGAEGEPLPEEDERLRRNLQEARTLHRLLSYSPRYERFWKNAEDPLDARVVICDEASMIDVDLMHALVEALPADARLILVGDADQLPAVSGGAVFRDLVAKPAALDDDLRALIDDFATDQPRREPNDDVDETMAGHTTRLLHSYRMEGDDGGRHILELAESIRECTDAADPTLSTRLGEAVVWDEIDDFAGVHRLSKDASRNDFVKAWFDRFASYLPPKPVDLAPGTTEETALRLESGEFNADSQAVLEALFDHYSTAQILCVTQVFRTGARAINRSMHKLHTARLPGDPSGKFLPLEPVMALQNNYDLHVFNGDQGVVVYARAEDDKEATLHAAFPRSDGGFRPIALSRLRHQLSLAYATSIHKAQGSEFEHVAVVLPETRLPLLTRQLLYTAVTRASKSVTVMDPNGLFETGAATPVERFTGLAGLLALRE